MDRKTILFRGKRCYIERERGREGEREASGRQEEWTKDEEVYEETESASWEGSWKERR